MLERTIVVSTKGFINLWMTKKNDKNTEVSI